MANEQTVYTIKLQDFQAHSKTEVRLTGGFAAIVGASNAGKSSIVRALRWVFFDSLRGSRFVRQGQDVANVSIEVGDVSVTRVKGKKQNRYIVGKTQYDAIGKGAPIEVTKALGVDTMRVDKDTTVELSIGQQMDPPFLVFEPESMRAKFVNVLTGGHVVDAAVRESNRVIKEIGEEAKRVEAEHTRVTQELAQYADLPEREAKIHELGEILGRANVCAQKAKILRETRERILAIRDQKSWANAKGHIVSWVTDTEVARVSNFTERLTILKRIKDSLAQIAWKRTSQVAQVTILAYVDDQTIVRTGQMGEYAKSLKAIKERLNGIRSQRIGATYALTALQDITPVLADHVRTLMDRRTALVQAQKSLADTRRKKTDTLNQLASVESRMEDLRHEVEALADGVCEACGQMVTKDVRRKQLMEIA